MARDECDYRSAVVPGVQSKAAAGGIVRRLHDHIWRRVQRIHPPPWQGKSWFGIVWADCDWRVGARTGNLAGIEPSWAWRDARDRSKRERPCDPVLRRIQEGLHPHSWQAIFLHGSQRELRPFNRHYRMGISAFGDRDCQALFDRISKKEFHHWDKITAKCAHKAATLKHTTLSNRNQANFRGRNQLWPPWKARFVVHDRLAVNLRPASRCYLADFKLIQGHYPCPKVSKGATLNYARCENVQLSAESDWTADRLRLSTVLSPARLRDDAAWIRPP